ncbi:MAG TPA: exonuclease SbcCD subunit D [Mycobacteriales bacterium]|nr:exonuclease SbcCD subunit D [Mycobacteriales bacterium]
MRLLHTSDWHLGRSLHRTDLRDAQAAFLDSLVETVRAERVDAVLVSGDVYDRAVPPLDAVAMLEDGLVRLRDAGARVVVTSGNHDSARRLGFGSRLVDGAGVHLRTRVADVAEPVLLEDAHGAVAVYGLPYLEPEAVRADLPAEPGAPDAPAPKGHEGVVRRAAACARADLAGRGGMRSVVLAHAWVTGGAASDSERDITVGGVGHVPASAFDGFTYTALGHLHGPQVLRDSLRYSGSPLPYSFSEAAHVKGSWLVELDARGLARVEHVPAPVHRRLTVLRAELDELLTSARFAEHEADFVSAVLVDPARPDAAFDRLRVRFPHLLTLSWEPQGAAPTGTYRERVGGRSDLDVVTGFVEHVRRTPADDGEAALLAEALEAGRTCDHGHLAERPTRAQVPA